MLRVDVFELDGDLLAALHVDAVEDLAESAGAEFPGQFESVADF